MKTLMLDRDDFTNEGVMTFDDVLREVGVVDKHGDPLKVDQVKIVVSSAKPE